MDEEIRREGKALATRILKFLTEHKTGVAKFDHAGIKFDALLYAAGAYAAFIYVNVICAKGEKSEFRKQTRFVLLHGADKLRKTIEDAFAKADRVRASGIDDPKKIIDELHRDQKLKKAGGLEKLWDDIGKGGKQ